MKLIYFRLHGYINILNGMGIDELIIPFNTFKNRIILITGQNGTGKSTIINALSPNPDGSDSFRTDVFIDSLGNRQIVEWPAEKELIYTDGINEYRILIQSLVDNSKTRRTTKAFIQRNGEELNVNGNVESFKEIRDSVLDIDPIYLDLSSISSENRGIVDMIPSERRKYMASYIGSLDTYNNIFKIISKKVTGLKSYINTINSKLYELGNEDELRLKQSQLETQLSDYNKNRDSTLKQLSEAETTMKLVDPDGKIQELYNTISENIVSINGSLTDIDKKLNSKYSSLSDISATDNIDEVILSKETLLDKYNNQLSEDKNSIDKLNSINEVLSNTINADKTKLSGLTKDTIQDNIETAVSELREKVDTYESYLSEDDIEILDNTSLDELLDLKDLVNKFKEEILAIEDLYSEDIFISGVKLFRNQKDISDTIKKYRDSIVDLNVNINNLKGDISNWKKNLEIIKDFNNTRPSNCKNDNCPYISNYINLIKESKTEKDIEKYEKMLLSYEKNLSDDNIKLDTTEKVLDIARKIESLINTVYNKSIFGKINKLYFMKDIDTIIQKIIIHNRFPEFDCIIDLLEKKSIYDDLVTSKIELANLESDLKIYLSNKLIINSLNESIADNESKYNSNNEKINSLMKDIIFLNKIIDELNKTLSIMKEIKDLLTEKQGLLERKDELKKSFEAVKDNIKLVKDKIDLISNLQTELGEYDRLINSLSETINKIKFTLSNIVQYQNELKFSSEQYDKLLFIRNCCSPGNGMGIQSEYIKRYMSDIIIDCNKMLSYMFNGALQLDIPVINEKQFSIPFISLGGIQVPDISNGSTAQKCIIGLIFSCVSMMKSSTKYNIPRLDEIDGGLDQSNRITFIQVLNQILDIMHSEQCVIISHNNEFDTYSTTKIICNPGGIRVEQ